ncbi:MAG: BolA/IbaG family iron-sulfur metabolism protein [Pseudomonadota bacterium]
MQEEVRNAIAAEFGEAEISVEVDGNRAMIRVVDARFADLNRVKRQQAVYACINDFIADGRLHAVTIQADTP